MRHVHISFILASLLLAACEHYRGDGTLSDAGFLTPHERYFVDLGAVSLGSSNRQSFKMVGLPATEFTIGLRPVYLSAGCDAAAL